jgi:propionyl-CoA carboxylase alpha chain
MLAKVIAWAPDRTAAARRLAGELARARIHGVGTNRDLLVRVLRPPAFLAGDTETAFFQRHGLGALAEPLADQAAARLSALAAALADTARRAATARVRVPSGRRRGRACRWPLWRNLVSQPQRKSYRAGDDTYQVEYRLTRDGLVAAGNVQLVESTADRVVLAVDGVRPTFE